MSSLATKTSASKLHTYTTTMRINEIFYSLQGEGYFTGTPSVFIRLSGCNLKCPFCDTHHETFSDMTEADIAAQAARYPATHVVITGGEPSMQLTASLIDALHQEGKFVAVETNGTHTLPPNVDWITLSPKDSFVSTDSAKPVLDHADEIKLVYTGKPLPSYPSIPVKHRFLQPCDTGHEAQNKELIRQAVDFCLKHPEWRISLQTHKILDIR